MINTTAITIPPYSAFDELIKLRKFVKQFVDFAPAPKDEQEELLLILKGYEKSIYSGKWVKYE
jgi:hypothetical protein